MGGLRPNSIDILLKNGIAYDHSLMHRDFEPCCIHHQQRMDRHRLQRPSQTSIKPFTRGKPTPLLEIPAYLVLSTTCRR